MEDARLFFDDERKVDTQKVVHGIATQYMNSYKRFTLQLKSDDIVCMHITGDTQESNRHCFGVVEDDDLYFWSREELEAEQFDTEPVFDNEKHKFPYNRLVARKVRWFYVGRTRKLPCQALSKEGKQQMCLWLLECSPFWFLSMKEYCHKRDDPSRGCAKHSQGAVRSQDFARILSGTAFRSCVSSISEE